MRLAGDRETRERGRAHPRKADLPAEVFIPSVPLVDELSLEECHLEIVDQIRIEDVVVAAEDTLYANIGEVGVRVRGRNSEGALILDAGVVYVVASREEVAWCGTDGPLCRPQCCGPNRLLFAE